MPQDLTEYRKRAKEHQRTLDAHEKWLTVHELAARWACSDSTVRDIPRDVLPYIELGKGLRYKRRRYDPTDVTTYETNAKAA